MKAVNPVPHELRIKNANCLFEVSLSRAQNVFSGLEI